jgi:WD40 repeat protein
MRAFIRGYLIWIGLCALSGTVIFWFIHKSAVISHTSEKIYDIDSLFCDGPYTLYSRDSIYKVVYDTIVRVWDTSSGEEINEFDVSVSGYREYPEIRQIELDPSGKFLAFLDNLNIIRVYNTFTGECEGADDYYYDEPVHIYFSDDLKYFLVVDYREATVDILSCPGLDFITTGYMECCPSNFYWENRDGKLVFYYEEGDSLYKTVFPDYRYPDYLVFSEPVNVGEYTR